MTETGHGDGRSTEMGSADWDERYEAGRLWSLEPNRFFVEAVDGLAGGRALDLACGEGRNALWLAQQGWDVTAVDFSEVAVDRGRSVADELDLELRWEVADLQTWDFGDEAWDLVAHVYLHRGPDDREPFLDRCAAAVAPGGRIVVVGHDRTNIEKGHGGPQDPDLLTTADELRERFGDSGLMVERAEVVHRPVQVDVGDGVTKEVDAIDHVVIATRA